MDARQECVFAKLAALLDSLDVPAQLVVVPDGRTVGAGWSIPWPEGEGERHKRRKEVVAQLEALTSGARLIVRREGDGGRQYWGLPWPAAQGLFDDPARASRTWPADWLAGREIPAEGKEAQKASGVRQEVQVLAARVELIEAEGRPEEGAGRPKNASVRCADLIEQLLGDVGRRLTLMELAEEFDRRRMPYASSAIEHTAAWMRRTGRLDNARDERGVGYGLPAWEDGPPPDVED